MKIIGIACVSSNNSIGFKNSLIFNISEDLKFFSHMTKTTKDINKKNAILMGKKTFESIGLRTLPGRINCVISTKLTFDNFQNYYYENKPDSNRQDYIPNNSSLKFFKSILDCLEYLREDSNIESIFVIGGEQIYSFFIPY